MKLWGCHDRVMDSNDFEVKMIMSTSLIHQLRSVYADGETVWGMAHGLVSWGLKIKVYARIQGWFYELRGFKVK